MTFGTVHRLPRADQSLLRLWLVLLVLAAGVGAANSAWAQSDSLFGPGSLGDAPQDETGTDDAVTDDTSDGDDSSDEPGMKGPTVKAVELAGIERVDEQAVRKQIRTVVGSDLDPAIVAEDLRRIFQMGLFDDVRVGLKKAGDGGVVVRFQVLERPSIAAITIRGNEDQSEEDVLKVVDLKVNHLYSPADAQRNAVKIKEMYDDEGYFLATVTHKVEAVSGNQVRVVFDIKERAEVKVRRIELLGNEGISDAEIKAVLKTQEGSVLSILSKAGNFKRDMLEYDLQVIQYLYLTKGYVQAKVEDPVVSLSPDMKYISIAIRVNEGPQFRVGKLDVTGDSVDPLPDMLKKVQLKTGDIFNYALVQQDNQALAGAQKNHGYAHATVSNESVPDVEKRVVDWTYHIQKGKKVYFGQILMQGGGSTRDKVIRRELTIAEGELYSEKGIQLSQARVQRLGFFESVEIKTRPTALPQVVDVVVDVKERTTGTFQVGMGYSSLDNFIVTAQIAKDNFLGRGQRMSVQGSLSSVRTMFQGSFYEPYFMDSNLTFSLDLFSYEQLYTDFSRQSTGGGMSWGYRLTDELTAEAGYNLEEVSTSIGGLSGRTDVPIASLFGSGLTSSMRMSLSYDDRDDRMFPTTGWFMSGAAEWAAQFLGSDNEFNRFTAKVRRYVPLPFDGVLKFNLVGGLIRAPEGKQVPLFERFFMGGIYNVRGFDRNTLGPEIAIPNSGDPASSLSGFNIGGVKQLYLNNEIEVPILKAPMNLRGLLFFDVGNAFGEAEDITLQDMRLALGWGVRWFSPVGPLRFEWGVPLNRKANERPLVFEFTIGNSF
jgi:outer membrane protein insertion porin family